MPRDAAPVALVCSAVAALACTSTVEHVRNGETAVGPARGVVVGRLALATRRRIHADSFELTAVRVPDGERFVIHLDPDRQPGAPAAAFFIQLPPGRYRLTRWQALAADRAWGGEDTGLAIDVHEGRAACVGSLYVPPRERDRRIRLDDGPDPTGARADVRDECESLAELLRRRAPVLGRSLEVRLAWRVN